MLPFRWRRYNWEASEGLVLPSSLSASNSGEFGSGNQFLPLSWQSLHHDVSLLGAELQPSVIAITDAPQLSNSNGKLVEALNVVRRRFPLLADLDSESQVPIIVRFYLG